jgi:hypothetical protein
VLLAEVELSLYPKFPMCVLKFSNVFPKFPLCSPTWSQVSLTYFHLMCFWLKLDFHCTQVPNVFLKFSKCVPQHGPKYHTFISCALAKVELSLYPKFPMCSPTWSKVSILLTFYYLMCFWLKLNFHCTPSSQCVP